jgi:hypothetical protein
MCLPSQAFSTLPPLVTTFLSNGLVLGTIIILTLEISESISLKRQGAKEG